jgi:glutamate-1-semialdehyde 2,1-aminomutase
MKTIAVVQARMGSTRFPGKVMKSVSGKPLIELLLRRLSGSQLVRQIIVGTSTDPANDPLVDCVRALGFACEQGSENDVLLRFADICRNHDADVVVRVTGDCPLIDPQVVDGCISGFLRERCDYFSNVEPATYPDGLDVEVFSAAALLKAEKEAVSAYDREHVTPYLRKSDQFHRGNLSYERDLSRLRWTVDEPVDLEVVKRVFAAFHPRLDFGFEEIVKLYEDHPELFTPNQTIRRNEGGEIGTGQKLWKRARGVIPGGNMLLSKRSEMFLPEQWPAYFSRANGCTVWDLDGRALTDVSIMGIGTNILGYGHPEVDAAVVDTVSKGIMSTLNCPEEVYLAERLVAMHPWADMVRFARSGGEANAIAVRIARAASGRDKIAICGYHGWHDWYLSANLADDSSLDGHLLPGLEPRGVPRRLAGTTLPFAYNDASGLEQLLTGNPDIGVIKMEVSRNDGPAPGFLERVRELADRHRAVLIFDECTSGFRETFGGLHRKYSVDPDIAMFGKALGNGYAITATIGRREIMQAAQSTFISSTFWTERIGPAAALKTLEVMEREKTWETITATGNAIRSRWQALADRHGLGLTHWGLPALTGFTIKSGNALAYKTLITQEMLAKGYLAGNSVYVSIAHTPEVINGYFECLNPIFGLIRECEDGRDVMELLKGPVCHAGFRRLN